MSKIASIKRIRRHRQEVATTANWLKMLQCHPLEIFPALHVQNKFLFILYTVSIWTTYVLTVYFCLKAVPETSVSTINTAITCLFFGSLAIVAVQGGLGVYPLVIGKVLLLCNITESIGYANGWLSWIVQTALILVLGFICMILINVMNKDTKSVDISNQ